MYEILAGLLLIGAGVFLYYLGDKSTRPSRALSNIMWGIVLILIGIGMIINFFIGDYLH